MRQTILKLSIGGHGQGGKVVNEICKNGNIKVHNFFKISFVGLKFFGRQFGRLIRETKMFSYNIPLK